MQRTPSINTILFYSTILAGLHALATYHNLYFYIWWFDIPMHILGGVLVGVAVLYAYHFVFVKASLDKNKRTTWLILLASVFFVGVGWEYFEFAKGITFNMIGSYRTDVLKDIIMDMLGGTFSGVYFVNNSKMKSVLRSFVAGIPLLENYTSQPTLVKVNNDEEGVGNEVKNGAQISNHLAQ